MKSTIGLLMKTSVALVLVCLFSLPSVAATKKKTRTYEECRQLAIQRGIGTPSTAPSSHCGVGSGPGTGFICRCMKGNLH